MEFFVGDEARAKRAIYTIHRPMENGLVHNWDDLVIQPTTAVRQAYTYLYRRRCFITLSSMNFEPLQVARHFLHSFLKLNFSFLVFL